MPTRMGVLLCSCRPTAAPSCTRRLTMQLGSSKGPASRAVHVGWSAGRLYAAQYPQGLLAIDADGTSTQLSPDLELGALSPASGGLWAIDRSTHTIVAIDDQGHVKNSLVDSSDGVGRPWHLAGAPDGGLFFSAGEGDSSGLLRRCRHRSRPQVAVHPGARGLALSNDGRTLYAVAVDDYDVWAFDVQDNGELLNRRAIAELFRGDGRYGRRDLQSAAPTPRRRA